jgi:hypothetical protein
VWKDVRLGVRSLLRDKGWTTVVVVSLALGIGANTALFSAVNGLYLRKLARRPPRLARAAEVGRPQRHGDQLKRLRIVAARR